MHREQQIKIGIAVQLIDIAITFPFAIHEISGVGGCKSMPCAALDNPPASAPMPGQGFGDFLLAIRPIISYFIVGKKEKYLFSKIGKFRLSIFFF